MGLTISDSLMYLPLADATVITFLAPSLACWACSYFINEPFTRTEQIAAYVSILGVVLIARPVSLFAALSHSPDSVSSAGGDVDLVHSNATYGAPNRLATDYDDVTPTQRATAVGIAMLGVFGSAGAYTTLRWIGKRAHPLLSVNYFATWCTIVSIIGMLVLPDVGFLLPRYFEDWCYLIFLGLCGFVMVCPYLLPKIFEANILSNSFSLPAFSMRNLLVQQTWFICRCCSRSPLISWFGAQHRVRCRSLVRR
jgi:drug/metabolite transporter (DMT)-like permease